MKSVELVEIFKIVKHLLAEFIGLKISIYNFNKIDNRKFLAKLIKKEHDHKKILFIKSDILNNILQ